MKSVARIVTLELHSLSIFVRFFYVVSMVHLLKEDLRPIIADNAKLIIETSK